MHLLFYGYSCGYYNYNFGLGLASALAKSRNCFLKILPAALFGTWSIMSTPPLRNLCFATRPRTQSCISLENAMDSAPGRGFTLGTMYALDEEMGGNRGWIQLPGARYSTGRRTLAIRWPLSQNTPQ